MRKLQLIALKYAGSDEDWSEDVLNLVIDDRDAFGDESAKSPWRPISGSRILESRLMRDTMLDLSNLTTMLVQGVVAVHLAGNYGEDTQSIDTNAIDVHSIDFRLSDATYQLMYQIS